MRAFVVIVSEIDVETASDVLWQLGVRAIEERRVAEPDGVELWTEVGHEPEAIERAVTALGDRWPSRLVEVVDVAADTWRDFAAPMRVSDDLVVVPAWLDEANISVNTTVVRIEPGGAFGLGDHPTTLLSLQALHRLVTSDTDVLDVGCGTGVIAVTAALLQDRPVRAIDIASAAVEATIDNADRNGVSDRIVVDTADLTQIHDTFDLVVANILAPVLVSLAADLRRVTRPAGRLVISGILADSHQHVLDALSPMRVVRTEVLDGWASVELRSG